MYQLETTHTNGTQNMVPLRNSIALSCKGAGQEESGGESIVKGDTHSSRDEARPMYIQRLTRKIVARKRT